jgi:hypothetical protein
VVQAILPRIRFAADVRDGFFQTTADAFRYCLAHRSRLSTHAVIGRAHRSA